MEWSFAQHEMKKLTAAGREVCEACGPSPFCVHVDGNHKLYRYKTGNSSIRPYHEGTIIKGSAEVASHLQRLDAIKSVSTLTLYCHLR